MSESRELAQAKKQQEKAERRKARRGQAPAEMEMVSADELQSTLPSVEEAMAAIEARGRGEVASTAAAIPARLFVGGVADEVTSRDLRELFSQHGAVADAVVMVDRNSGSSRGFGFVTMENRKDAPRAIEALDGTEFAGRRLVVNVATDRQR